MKVSPEPIAQLTVAFPGDAKARRTRTIGARVCSRSTPSRHGPQWVRQSCSSQVGLHRHRRDRDVTATSLGVDRAGRGEKFLLKIVNVLARVCLLLSA